MTHLDAILGTLLLRNNCVIIPSLGGFVANNVSAKVDVKNGLITPPTKALSFNKNLTNNDGLIIHHLANSKKISFDEAQSIIALEVQQIKASLNQEKRVNFHNVGFLYVNSAGKIAFEQDRFFNLLLSSYGLGTVQFITEQEEAKVERPQAVAPEKKTVAPIKTIEVESTIEKVIVQPVADKNEDTQETKEILHPAVAEGNSRKLLSQIIKYTAVAALVPVLFYSYWIPMRTDVLQSGVVYIEDFNPFNSTSKSEKYTPDVIASELAIDSVHPSESLSSITDNLSSSAPVFAYPLNDDLFITVKRKDDYKNTTKVETIKTVEAVEAVTSPKINSYHAIVGCFSNSINASELIQDLKSKGFDAYQVDVQGGLHRVSAGNSKNRSGMNTLRQRLFDVEVSSWVLKK